MSKQDAGLHNAVTNVTGLHGPVRPLSEQGENSVLAAEREGPCGAARGPD